MRARRSPTAPPPRDRHARVRAMVEEHLKVVTRTLRRAGVPPSDLDDEVQRTFMVAATRIDDVQVGAERGFLVQVAQNLAWHARRKMARRREVLGDDPPERIEAVATPEFLAHRKQMRELLDAVLETISEPLRTVFKLFEFEQMSMTEVARKLHLPRGTIASRLRRARAQFRERVETMESGGGLRDEVTAWFADPARLRRERLGPLYHALLAAGASPPASAAAYANTLSALGLAGLRAQRR
ncbi:MAG TPA: sigma-70 family RNA polymerase sigma factor [Polyangia bacterium]